jgi:hypothetical protein
MPQHCSRRIKKLARKTWVRFAVLVQANPISRFPRKLRDVRAVRPNSGMMTGYAHGASREGNGCFRNPRELCPPADKRQSARELWNDRRTLRFNDPGRRLYHHRAGPWRFQTGAVALWDNPPGFVSSTSEKLTWKTISMSGARLTTGEGAWEAA